MSQDSKRMKWENETGQIKLQDERVFVMSRDFIEEFKKELISTSGESTFRMTMRKVLEKLGIEQGDETASWESFIKYNDEQILPVSTEDLNIPPDFKAWDGTSRQITLLPDISMEIWTVKSIQLFKEVLTDIMTEKGANAMINSAGKKAGISIGADFVKYFGWADLDSAIANIDEAYKKLNAACGLGLTSASCGKGADGKDIILLKTKNSFESVGMKSSIPTCAISSSYKNGLWNSIADSLGQAAEAREVKCTAKGDPYCAFAIKFKDKGAPPIDWKEIASDWQGLE